MATTATDSQDINPEFLGAALAAIQEGATLGDVAGIEQPQLEALYALGYRLYSAGNFKDATTIFQSLCLYDYSDRRFWMGLAGSQQGAGNLEQAAEAYGIAGVRGNLQDPEPFYYAALCFLKLGKLEETKSVLEGIARMDAPTDENRAVFKQKAADMLEVIRLQTEGKGALQ